MVNIYSIKSKTYQSNFELTSKENVDSIGVIASSAVCLQHKKFQNTKSVLERKEKKKKTLEFKTSNM